jgi:small ligand-binding sensory domain FIST
VADPSVPELPAVPAVGVPSVGLRTFGAGLAAGPDLLEAADRALAQALEGLSGPPDLIAVFVSAADAGSEQFATVGQRVTKASGAAHVIGCTAGGVLADGQACEGEAAVSIWAGNLPGARLRSFHLEVIPVPAGMTVIGMPVRADDDVAVMVLADPWSFPAESFVDRVDSSLPGLAVVGGLVSGSPQAGGSRLLLDGLTHKRGAVGIIIGGDVDVQTVVAQGCRAIGSPMTVTRAEGNVIFELAGQPALAKVEQIVAALDEDDRALVRSGGLMVGVSRDEYADGDDPGDYLVRGILGADASRSGLAIGEVVQVGQTVTLQVRDAAAADMDLRKMLNRSVDDVGGSRGALLFCGNSRGRALFADGGHDGKVVQEVLGAQAVGGFFADGELGPVSGRNYLHGFTASLLAFR